MCGKKSNHRQGGQEQPKRQYLDTSLFYYEYLNSSLNYILSGKNDLDHLLQFDIPAARQITSTEPVEENIHFVERVKLMKPRCDPNTYLKDVQEYGEFINYEVSRAHNQEIASIESQLKEEFDIGIKLKRIKKKYKRNDDKLSLYHIRQHDKQWRSEILNGIINQFEGKQTERDSHLEENKLYREMFNIPEVVTIKKEEKIETKKIDKPKGQRGPKRKTNQDYRPSISKMKEPYGERLGGSTVEKLGNVEDKVKKEEYVQKNPIRFFNTSHLSSYQLPTPPPAPHAPFIQFPLKLSFGNSILPMVILPSQPIIQPMPIEEIKPIPEIKHNSISEIKPIPEIKPIEKIQNEPQIIKQPQVFQNPQPHVQKEDTIDLPFPQDSNNASSPQKRKKNGKKIQKEEKEKVRKPRGPKQKEQKQRQRQRQRQKQTQKPQQRQKRKYQKRQASKADDVRFPAHINPFINQSHAPQYVSRATSCVEIGIQADANQDFQNMKVLAPRQLPFTFEPIRPAIPPLNPPHEETREIIPERRESENLNSSNNLSNSHEMGERVIQNQPPSNIVEGIEMREEPVRVLDSLRRNSESHDKKEDFDVSYYLI